jgi:hypothetical protein
MNTPFRKFAQTCFAYQLRDHLAGLQGAAITDTIDAPIAGSWIEFTYGGHSFTINEEAGEFVFSVEEPECPQCLLSDVSAHFEPFFAERGHRGEGGDITLRGV